MHVCPLSPFMSKSQRRLAVSPAPVATFRPWPAVALLAAVTAATMLWGAGSRVQAQGCGVGVNPIVCENQKTGSPSSDWQITGAGDSTIQGFATAFSVAPGQTQQFKIDTDASAYTIDIYRMGYYGGFGARLVTSVAPSATLPQNQPNCIVVPSTGLVDCGNWALSASWTMPADAVSGIYFARLERLDSGGASHIFFVVRDDTSGSDILFQTSDTTWQAYNSYGGNSFYVGGPGNNPGRAYKLSYNRPFNTRDASPEDFVFNAEYPMVRWLERNGYDVSYTSGIDTDHVAAELLEHRVFLSVGHDEYWSGTQRTNVEAARAAGVNLAFLSGNEVFWKTRWEPSVDGSNTPYRTLVSYKETHANAVIDPAATDLDRHLARRAIQPARRWRPARTRPDRPVVPRQRRATTRRSWCRRPKASCGSGAIRASPRWPPERPRPCPTARWATNGTKRPPIRSPRPA